MVDPNSDLLGEVLTSAFESFGYTLIALGLYKLFLLMGVL